MTDDALNLLMKSPAHAALLRAYERDLSESAAPHGGTEARESGWTRRITDVDGIDSVLLAPMHGKLIAHGLLNFELTDRTSGVLYRVSPEGRHALRMLSSGRTGDEHDPVSEHEDDCRADAA